MKQYILACTVLACVANTKGNLMEPYSSIKPLEYKMQSMFNGYCVDSLRRIIALHRPKVVVEIGTFTGASAIFMAQLIEPQARLYAVDTFLGSVEHHEVPEYRAFLPNLYLQFLSNCMHAQVAHKIIPVRMSSEEAAIALNIHPDLIYIDGSHEENDVFNDIMWWHEKMSPNGKMCGDDYGWTSVTAAVHRAASALNKKVRVNGGFWEFI
ncbi:MAG: class I SAM-dependent methyltransferase [Candidatus Babeliaceae bacterium]|jgi:hypothetical protein